MAKADRDRELVITRLIAAPRELVFTALTTREHVSNWWGPNGFTTTTREMDVRAGGWWIFTMHGPDGVDYPNRIRYTAVDPPARIAYDHDGGAGSSDLFEGEITLLPQGNRTLVTLRMRLSSPQQREAMIKFGAIEGGEQTLARLDTHLTSNSNPVFEMSRTFAAPRELVWSAHSDEQHLRHWWGPKGTKLDIAHLDFRTGGMFHYAMRYSTGTEMWGRFFYREIRAPARLSYLSSFANADGGISRAPFSQDCPLEMLNELSFQDAGARTILHLRVTPFGAAENERAFFRGLTPSLTQGYGGTLDQLESYLARVKSTN